MVSDWTSFEGWTRFWSDVASRSIVSRKSKSRHLGLFRSLSLPLPWVPRPLGGATLFPCRPRAGPVCGQDQRVAAGGCAGPRGAQRAPLLSLVCESNDRTPNSSGGESFRTLVLFEKGRGNSIVDSLRGRMMARRYARRCWLSRDANAPRPWPEALTLSIAQLRYASSAPRPTSSKETAGWRRAKGNQRSTESAAVRSTAEPTADGAAATVRRNFASLSFRLVIRLPSHSPLSIPRAPSSPRSTPSRPSGATAAHSSHAPPGAGAIESHSGPPGEKQAPAGNAAPSPTAIPVFPAGRFPSLACRRLLLSPFHESGYVSPPAPLRRSAPAQTQPAYRRPPPPAPVIPKNSSRGVPLNADRGR
jgi:hypothetical protein